MAYVANALDGIGGMYTASSAALGALAALEVLVHVDPLTAPSDLRLLAIDIPDDLSPQGLEPAELPKDWSTVPAPASLQALVLSWLKSGRSAALSVP